MQGWEREIYTLSVETPQPHNANLPIKRNKEKWKTEEDAMGRTAYDNKKALALLLKPTNPTPSNTGSERSFHRVTERTIKVLRYSEVLHRGGA